MKPINPIEYPQWDQLLHHKNHGCIFHSSAWAKIIVDTYKYKPIYFLSKKNDGIDTLIPMMEVNSHFTGKRGISLPFSDYCNPVMRKRDNFKDCLDFIVDYGKRCNWSYVDLRGGELESDIPPFKFFYIHTLELSKDIDQLFKNLRNSNKRNIKKAQKNLVNIRFSHSLDSLKTFYSLHCTTRKRHGVPPQPFNFFYNIYKHILSPKKGVIITAVHEDTPISASLFFHFGNNAIYKFGASDLRFQHLRANNLVMWEAIKWYAENGYHDFCFGRTEPENNGLLQFKSGWNAQQKTINYYMYDFQRDRFITEKSNNYQIVNTVFKHVPITMLKALGKILYPHVA